MTSADHLGSHADPDEYTPGPDPVTAAQEYTPEGDLADATMEADPADIVDQLTEVPDSDDDGPDESDDFD